MTKRRIKIVILFILITAVLVGGWRMYKKLEYDKQSFDTDIYAYVSSRATEVININREYYMEKLFVYDPSLSVLTGLAGDNIHYPVVISKYADGRKLLAFKAGREQEYGIRERLEKRLALPFPPKAIKYKDAGIYIYALANNDFLACSFYKGLFFASRHYRLMEDAIDSGPGNAFFSGEDNKEIMEKIRLGAPVSMYMKLQNSMLALDYGIYNDTMKMEGFVLNRNKPYPPLCGLESIPFMINLPDSICVEDYMISDEKEPASVKIILNKIY
ncbi:MAG: hypothetical protein LBR26_07325 [Prevotella sp.]|jgi:hypothetical protein|nr:hypothetical protein [Prevotella sp.]